MTALGMTALHLRIVDFTFMHNFIICNRLPDTEIIFGIDIQKKISISYVWDKAKNCYIQKDENFLHTHETVKWQQWALLNQPLRYHQDTMVSYQLRSQVKQLRNIWLTLLLMRTPQKEGTLTITSPMASIASKGKHLLRFWCLIKQANTLSSTKENT